VQVEVEKKTVTVKRDRVAAVALSTELVSSLKPKGAYARLVLDDGCRLSLSAGRCADAQSLTGTTLFDAPVRVGLDHVVALYICQGRAVYLSDLKPRQYEHKPYLSLSWPYVLDGSVTGRDLRLAGNTFDRGIGMHSESRLTYEVGAGYLRFEALAGLDERSGRGGSARVRVLVDGKPQELGWDRELTGQDKPLRVRVGLTGARELTLVVEFGPRGDILGRVDWVDARLVK
jgi:NPCBM/NEW2 domain